jgi:crossover junction endodeoxyribonuclease RuvC
MTIGCWLGIDPGKHGGFAMISGDDIAQAWPMPATEAGIGRLFHSRIKPAGVTKCLIEKVHSMPGEGVASVFKFGRNDGVLIGMLIAHGIEYEEIPPETWQMALGIPRRAKVPRFRGAALYDFPAPETKAQWKKRLRSVAQQLFPQMGEKITLETADALLIAEVAKRIATGYRGRAIS